MGRSRGSEPRMAWITAADHSRGSRGSRGLGPRIAAADPADHPIHEPAADHGPRITRISRIS